VATIAGERLTLREYETRLLPMSDDAARDLGQLAGKRLDVSVGPAPGVWKVTATQHVGTLVTPSVEVLVRPKIPLENLFLLLDVELPPVAWGNLRFGYGADDHLLAAFAELFVRNLEHTLAQGVLRAYREHREREVALRGRLDVPGLMRMAGASIPVPCRYDELTPDVVENRYLKAATRRLLRVPGVLPRTRAGLRRIVSVLDGVADVDQRPEALDQVCLTRLSRYYDSSLRLAQLVLRNLGLVDRPGGNDASSFMLDMNELFQRWVTDRLRRQLRGRLVVDAEPVMALGERNQVKMAPDLVFRDGNEPVLVGDVKYKLTSTGLGRAPDYYQLLAYATVTGLSTGVLVYCQHTGAAPNREVVVRRGGQRLLSYPLDLRGSRAEIEAAVADLADWIETHEVRRDGTLSA
jgi:5-methylcytosine-specific restriction enzyme subunit McrC